MTNLHSYGYPSIVNTTATYTYNVYNGPGIQQNIQLPLYSPPGTVLTIINNGYQWVQMNPVVGNTYFINNEEYLVGKLIDIFFSDRDVSILYQIKTLLYGISSEKISQIFNKQSMEFFDSLNDVDLINWFGLIKE